MEGSRPVKGGKLEMDNPVTRISVRNLVEFILQSGDLDNPKRYYRQRCYVKGQQTASEASETNGRRLQSRGCFADELQL